MRKAGLRYLCVKSRTSRAHDHNLLSLVEGPGSAGPWFSTRPAAAGIDYGSCRRAV
jgi:hypothetical protein